MSEFKTIKDVWTAIDQGKEVFWGNTSYHITIEDAYPTYKGPALRGGKILRVTCISNYFGSALCESEVTSLFTKKSA